jgi:arylformamidase
MTDLFRIRDHVADFAGQVEGYRVASAATRSRIRNRLDIAYGPHPDERLDLFFPAQARTPSPVHLFVHGGYWRAFSKEDYSFIADAVTGRGAIAAIMDYSLMPAARMDRLVDQVRRAARWLRANAADFGGDGKAFSASGHSAGGHLACYLGLAGPAEHEVQPSGVRAILVVSALFDLQPVSRSFVQEEIGLTPGEIAAWSPMEATPTADCHWDIVVGSGETAPFHQQADQMREHLWEHGLAPRTATIPGEEHMSIVAALGRPGTVTAERLLQTIDASREVARA